MRCVGGWMPRMRGTHDAHMVAQGARHPGLHRPSTPTSSYPIPCLPLRRWGYRVGGWDGDVMKVTNGYPDTDSLKIDLPPTSAHLSIYVERDENGEVHVTIFDVSDGTGETHLLGSGD